MNGSNCRSEASSSSSLWCRYSRSSSQPKRTASPSNKTSWHRCSLDYLSSSHETPRTASQRRTAVTLRPPLFWQRGLALHGVEGHTRSVMTAGDKSINIIRCWVPREPEAACVVNVLAWDLDDTARVCTFLSWYGFAVFKTVPIYFSMFLKQMFDSSTF